MTTRLALAQRRLLEGSHPWGSYQVNVSRSGVVHHRLTVYPPGANSAERRALAGARDWPVAGALGALLAIIGLGRSIGSLLLLSCVTVVYLLGIVWTRLRIRRLRLAVRTIDAVNVHNGARTSRGASSRSSSIRSRRSALWMRARLW